MRCPDCGHTTSKVVDSRGGPDSLEIRRRRECESCASRFTTYERMELAPPMVVKRDGRREAYDPEKLRRALRTACRKRPVSADQIERMVGRVTRKVGAFGEREVASESIGRSLLEELAAVDEVSYARFASVYLRFESLEDFESLLLERGG